MGIMVKPSIYMLGFFMHKKVPYKNTGRNDYLFMTCFMNSKCSIKVIKK